MNELVFNELIFSTPDTIIPKLYYNYKKRGDGEIREKLKNIEILKKIEGDFHALNKKAITKILKRPRNIAINFDDSLELKRRPIKNLSHYKTIPFLVKSSSRFFLKADIGEVFDQFTFEDFYSSKIKAICINDDYKCLEGTSGEHFIMLATLFV